MKPRQPITLDDAVAIARLWREADLSPEVELGALEPLLWREGDLLPPDLVRALKTVAKTVTMTTNASRLAPYAGALAEAGLDLLRVSWHTTDPALFAEMSGQAVYDDFYRGIQAAAAAGLRLSFNRVLFNGRTEGIDEQIEFIRTHNSRLKLYDLMWTPELADIYDDVYQDWRPIVRKYVLPFTERTEVIPAVGRKRIKFWLSGGGHVEVKVDGTQREQGACVTCAYRNVCIEEFGDYVRVEPELTGYFCYLRRDIAIDLRAFTSGPDGAARLRRSLNDAVPNKGVEIARYAPLRLITVPYCNFNCFLPGTNISWCHKTTGNFAYPGRQNRVA